MNLKFHTSIEEKKQKKKMKSFEKKETKLENDPVINYMKAHVVFNKRLIFLSDVSVTNNENTKKRNAEKLDVSEKWITEVSMEKTIHAIEMIHITKSVTIFDINEIMNKKSSMENAKYDQKIEKHTTDDEILLDEFEFIPKCFSAQRKAVFGICQPMIRKLHREITKLRNKAIKNYRKTQTCKEPIITNKVQVSEDPKSQRKLHHNTILGSDKLIRPSSNDFTHKLNSDDWEKSVIDLMDVEPWVRKNKLIMEISILVFIFNYIEMKYGCPDSQHARSPPGMIFSKKLAQCNTNLSIRTEIPTTDGIQDFCANKKKKKNLGKTKMTKINDQHNFENSSNTTDDKKQTPIIENNVQFAHTKLNNSKSRINQSEEASYFSMLSESLTVYRMCVAVQEHFDSSRSFENFQSVRNKLSKIDSIIISDLFTKKITNN